MYKQRSNGTFRLRASFPIDSERVIAMNAICNKLDMSFEKVCKIAVDRLVNDFTQNGQVVIPEDMPQKKV
ncbi:MAG: hypothetical protein L3J75_17825 [Methylococcaceae bacterium]|nr:hypothetical protein [Methylococcaceae bacterium]